MSGGTVAMKWVVILAVAAMFSAGFLVIAADRLESGPSGYQADTTTHGNDISCGNWMADYKVRGGGRFPSPPGTGDKDGAGAWRGEIWDRTVVWYSWFMGGMSQSVIGQAVQRECGGGTAPIAGYTFSINNQDGNWRRFHQDRVPLGQLGPYTHDGGWEGSYFPAISFEIDGYEWCSEDTTGGCPDGKSVSIVDGAILKVDAWVAYAPASMSDIGSSAGALIGGGGGWVWLASDQLSLRSALPNVHWSEQGYRIGETAVASWEIPVVHYDTGNNTMSTAYFLTILDCNTNMPLEGWSRTPLETETGQAKVPVTDAMFSNKLESCQNRLRAIIYTQLIRIADADASIQPTDAWLKKEGLTIPVVTEIVFDKKDYFEGDTITATWKATGNITKFHVKMQLNGQLLVDEDVDAGVLTKSTVAPSTGLLVMEVTGYSYCVPSDVKPASVWVGNAYPAMCEVYPDVLECVCQADPNDPRCGTDLVGWIILVLAVVALVIVVLVVAYVTHKLLPDAPWVAALVALITFCVVTLAFLSWGFFDAALGVVH